MAKMKNDETKRAREVSDAPALSAAQEGEEAAAAPSPAAIPVKEDSRKEGMTVYIGPTLHGKIQKGTVFAGGKPEAADIHASVIAEYPAVFRLIVPVERLAEARNDIAAKKGLIYKDYKELLNRAFGM